MDQKKIYHIVEWVVALAACGYLIYRLAIYEDYATLWATLCNMSLPQIAALLLCVALMPVNMSLEAWRWKTLLPMSWREAHQQVYYSKLAGLITPWRLGEYPARALLMENQESAWPRVLSMGAVGSATMTAAIVLAGTVSMAFSPQVLGYLGGSYLYALMAVIFVLMAGFILLPKVLKKWAEVNTDLMLRSLGQSFVRLACWCVQLALVLYALSVFSLQYSVFSFQLSEFRLLPIYYLLITITPNVPIAEVGVRGAWAIVVFGSMNAALAGVLLWGINTLLPCLIGAFLLKKYKINLRK